MFDRMIRKMINNMMATDPPERVFRAAVNTIRRQEGGFWGRMMEAEFARQILTDPRFRYPSWDQDSVLTAEEMNRMENGIRKAAPDG